MHSRPLRTALLIAPTTLLFVFAAFGPSENSYADDSEKKRPNIPDAGTCNDAGIPHYSEPVDPNDPCQSLLAEGAPLARAAWVTPPYPLVIVTKEIALSWGVQLAARVPLQGREAYTLEIERCDTPAHSKTTCSTSSIAMPATECGTSMMRFGLDPTEYARGTNQYSFNLRLRHGCVVDSEDTFNLTLEYRPER